MNLQIKAIESFVCLYRERNMTKASAKIFISQQGLSRQIQALEKELDVILFVRSNAGVEPTEACRLLFPGLNRMYNEYLNSMSTLHDFKRKRATPIPLPLPMG